MVERHIIADVINNDMCFWGMRDVKGIANALQSVKDVTVRISNNRVYTSAANFHTLRKSMMDYLQDIKPTTRFKTLRDLTRGDKVIIEWYPSKCKVLSGPLPMQDIIPASSYFNKKYKNMEIYKRGGHSGMEHLFNFTDCTFPSGLLEKFIEIFNKHGIPFEVKRMFSYPEKHLDLTYKLPFTPSQDQYDAVNALDKANTGIGKLPTGFGKTSFVSVALIAQKGVRAMFIANQRVLINDAKDDFESAFGHCIEGVGVIGDGEYNPQDITVASIQGIIAALQPPTPMEFQQIQGELSLAEYKLSREENKANKSNVTRLTNRLKNMEKQVARAKDIRLFLTTVEMVIIDEGQVLGTKMWDKFFAACPAPYRYTLTATDTRTDGGRIELIAATGPRRYESSASEQIEKGRLADFKATYLRFDHGVEKDVLKAMRLDYHLAYDEFIVKNDKRNSLLCDWVIKWQREGFSILALVTRKEHGEIIQQMLIDKGLTAEQFHYVDGDTSKKERQRMINEFREGEVPILIGTSIFDVGFNAKNASKMVRFNAGGSEVTETQRAGRTVRKRDDDSIGEMVDVLDMNCPYFQSQGEKRRKLIAKEFGEQRVTIEHKVHKGETTYEKLQHIADEIADEMDKATLLAALNDEGFEIEDTAIGDDYAEQLQLLQQDDKVSDILQSLQNFDPSIFK